LSRGPDDLYRVRFWAVQRSGGDILATFAEVETGKRNDRPQLQAALTFCRQKKAVLIIATLDSPSRNVALVVNLK